MTKPQRLLQKARELAQKVESWADLSNALFNASDGLLTTAYRTRAERQAFTKSKEYKEIVSLIDRAKERFGLIEGATPKKSGRFVVRLPQTLHAALEREAASEGVSLNQLAVSKLSIPLSDTLQRLHGK
jgi:predicted HicB family RNase H-like nuclease